ncbi:phosphatase PAP2 family protein [Micromonospora sp. URMC 103]|uniref:phosphatase PAP2 family protein n=1 Tax=Micromonospora sp. URMC 103 TaxID=3423406 RepID=UPI003F19FF8D
MGADHRRTRPHPIRELLIVAALFLAYKAGRLLTVGDLSTAYASATHVWSVERALGLPDEASLQQSVLSHHGLVRLANTYYASVHFPATGALLLFTYLFRPDLYRWGRTLLAALSGVGFAIQALLPMAPPRLLSATGVLDTGQMVGPRAYGDPATDTLSNQYAAMPSLHVGWATVVAIVLIAAGRTRWRWLWLLHPVLTLTVVVVTGNHYWLDAVAALALLGSIVLLARRPRAALLRPPVAARSDAGATNPAAALAAVTAADGEMRRRLLIRGVDGWRARRSATPARRFAPWQGSGDLVAGVLVNERTAGSDDQKVVAGEHEHRQHLG